MNRNQKLTRIEDTIDSCVNYAEFIELLAEVCSAKAEQYAAEHDGLMEEICNRRAADLLEHTNRVTRSFD